MPRALLALLVALLAGPVAAQPATAVIQCAPAAESVPDPDSRADFMTLDRFALWLGHSAPGVAIAKARQTADAAQTIELSVQRPGSIPREDWERAWFEALAYPASFAPSALPPASIVVGRVRPPVPSGEDRRVIAVEFPELGQGWLPGRWQVNLLVCIESAPDPARNLARIREIRAFGAQPIFFSSLWLSAVIGILGVVVLYVAIGLAAADVHERQLAFLRAREPEGGSRVTRLGFALRPTVVMQDAFGTCSLARFQVLLFTLVLSGVYTYVLVRTGELSGLSTTVLALLGITLAGSTLARATGGPVVDTPNRLWLLGTGVLDRTPRLPAWRDLIAGDGEIDVTRVQAVAFSLFAAAALVINGTTDLAGFEIPPEINYLMGISQVVYIAGRALPQEAATRLNEELRAIRTAETRVLFDPADVNARKDFETARGAIGATLFDIFGERFDARALAALTPGQRVAAA